MHDTTKVKGSNLNEVWPFRGAVLRFADATGASHAESSVIEAMTLDFFRLKLECIGAESEEASIFFIGGTWVLDHFWHTLILDTRLYARFCDAFFGTFIHHTPRLSERDSDAAPTEEEIRSQVRLSTRLLGSAKTRALFLGLAEVYGTLPRKKVSPIEGALSLLNHPLIAPYRESNSMSLDLPTSNDSV